MTLSGIIYNGIPKYHFSSLGPPFHVCDSFCFPYLSIADVTFPKRRIHYKLLDHLRRTGKQDDAINKNIQLHDVDIVYL